MPPVAKDSAIRTFAARYKGLAFAKTPEPQSLSFWLVLGATAGFFVVCYVVLEDHAPRIAPGLLALTLPFLAPIWFIRPLRFDYWKRILASLLFWGVVVLADAIFGFPH
jgi:hypothetical protein